MTATCWVILVYLIVNCRPFYFPLNFSVEIITTVYVPSDGNVDIALRYLHSVISKQQNKYPQVVHMITGNFNQADFKVVLPKFEPHTKFTTSKGIKRF